MVVIVMTAIVVLVVVQSSPVNDTQIQLNVINREEIQQLLEDNGIQ